MCARAVFTSSPFPHKSAIDGIVPYTAADLQTVRRNSRPTRTRRQRVQLSPAATAWASHYWKSELTADEADAWNALGIGHDGGVSFFDDIWSV